MAQPFTMPHHDTDLEHLPLDSLWFLLFGPILSHPEPRHQCGRQTAQPTNATSLFKQNLDRSS